jgi:hypothetical protein
VRWMEVKAEVEVEEEIEEDKLDYYIRLIDADHWGGGSDGG